MSNRRVQTNFRAEDMGGSTVKSKATKKAAPAPEEPKTEDKTPAPAPAPAAESNVPTGSAREVLEWVGDDQSRAEQALSAENKRENPRKSVVSALEEKLTK